MAFADPLLVKIERKLDENVPLSMEDGLALYGTWDIHNLGRIARKAKERKSGKKVFYVLNRYINSTNVCFAGCTFCSFAADEFKEPERIFRMTADQVFAKAIETGTNFNQIHIVGGHDPRQLSLDYWLPLMRRFKATLPHVQLSLFTAAEIEYMAKRHRLSFPAIVAALKEAGLDNVNGGAAEIFGEPTRGEDLPEQSFRRQLVGDSRRAAPPGRREQRDHAVRPYRVARGARRSPDSVARIARAVARVSTPSFRWRFIPTATSSRTAAGRPGSTTSERSRSRA